jgi:hypothetical protein
MMARSVTLLAGAAILAAALSGPAFSQGAPQTLSLMKVDPQSVATGYRTSKVVRSPVVNEANETVGTIDDLIVTPNEKVPFSALQVKDKRMMLPGATKDSLKSLPEFKYSTSN